MCTHRIQSTSARTPGRQSRIVAQACRHAAAPPPRLLTATNPCNGCQPVSVSVPCIHRTLTMPGCQRLAGLEISGACRRLETVNLSACHSLSAAGAPLSDNRLTCGAYLFLCHCATVKIKCYSLFSPELGFLVSLSLTNSFGMPAIGRWTAVCTKQCNGMSSSTVLWKPSEMQLRWVALS